MNYAEMIAKAFTNRSVNAMAKMWGIPQKTLDRYCKGETLPDYDTAEKIADQAGIERGVAFAILAEETRLRKIGGPPVSRTRHQRIMSPLL
jgi:predicted transcriptional regulator